MEKVCTKCEKQKSISSYHNDKRWKYWKVAKCKQCCTEYNRLNAEHISKKRKEHYKENKERILKRTNLWAVKNPEKIKQIKHNHYLRNKDEFRTKSSQWKKDNPEKVREQSRLYRDNNRDKERAKCRRYAKNNHDKIIAKNRKRELSKIQRVPKWAINEIMKVYYFVSQWMSRVMNKKYVVDHIVPIRWELVSWLHVQSNLQVITEKENLLKSNNFTN
jgi:hypothetical protein